MVRALLLILFLGIAAHAQTITIVSANLQHGEGTDNVFNPTRQAAAFSGADIVLTQEQNTGVTSWNAPMAGVGLSQAVFKAHWGSPGDGNAIWVKNTVTVLQTYNFDMANGTNPSSGSAVFGWDGVDVRRTLVAIKAQVGSTQFYVVSLHLVASSGEDNSNTNFASQRVDQINSALNWVSANLTGGLPIIIGGDFNLPPNYPRAPERSFTADTTTDTLTSTAHGFSNGTAVSLRNSGGAPPSPLLVGTSLYALATVYYVRDASPNSFKLAASPGGPAIDLTNNGTGSHFASATQWDLFHAGYYDLWQEGLGAGTASVPWADRDANGVADMPLDFQLTRTHDTRRIDYIVMSRSTTNLTLSSITVQDNRAACSTALTSNGAFKECPDVVVQTDTPDDFGVKPSDHNFTRAVLTVSTPTGPTAALSCPSTALVGEPVVCDGSGSSGVHGQVGWSTEAFEDGSAPVTMNFGDSLGAYSESTLLKAPHAYLTPGTYTVGLTVRSTSGASASTSAQITVSAIPAATGGAIQTLTDLGSHPANCAAVNTALATAMAANTVEQEILLPAIPYMCGTGGAPNITFPAPTGTKYVTIRPANISWLPGPLVRVTPTPAASMPTFRAAGADLTPITIGTGTGYIRFLGIAFDKGFTGHLHNFMQIGSGATTYAQLPHHIIVDRCYFKGNTNDDTVRAIFVNADKFSLLNSYLVGLHSSGEDAQAISGFAGSGIAIVNNHLEGYGENVLFGGADAGIKFSATCASATSPTGCVLNSAANLRVGDGISLPVAGGRGPWSASIVRSIAGSTITFDQITNQAGTPTAPDTTSNGVKFGASPQDIFVARNYLFKSRTFRVGDPTYAGTFAVVKNSFELKHAMRVVVVANFIENMWGNQGQDGHTILLTPRNQTCYLLTPPSDPATCPEQTNPWTMVRDVEFADNRARNIPDLFNILGTDTLNPPGEGRESGPSALVQYIAVRNFLVDGVDPGGGSGQLALLWPGTRHLTFSHNTLAITPTGGSWILTSEAPIGHLISDALIVNNIAPHQTYGLFGDGRLADNAIAYFFSDGFIRYNVLSDDFSSVGPNGEIWSAPRGGPNYFPATINTNTFIDMAGGNYRLKPTSPYKAGNATPAADGTDIGVNFDRLVAATASTVSGNWLVATNNSGSLKGRTTLNGKAVIR